MSNLDPISELQNNQPLKSEFINYWLKENTTNFYRAVEKTECHKWKKWQRDNSIFVLPCVCPTRNNECVFIETYKELEKHVQTVKTDNFYKNLLEQYSKIQQNQNAVFEWINHIEQYGKELLFKHPSISVRITREPYYCVSIQLDTTEFPNLWEFKDVFRQYYYSEEYENYTNH